MPVFLYNVLVKTQFNKTNKYKYCNAFYFFTLPYSYKRKAALKLLTNIIGESSLNYDTKDKMSYKKDMLYGASIVCDLSDNGDYLTFRLNYSFLNPKFTNTNVNEYIDFFKEIMFNTLLTNVLLEENKRIFIDNIKRLLEKPNVLARNKVINIIAQDDSSINSHNIDIIKDLEAVTLDDLKEAYKDLINDSDVLVCMFGDLEDTTINEFKAIKLGGNTEYHTSESRGNYIPKDMVIDEMPYSQSSLYLVYVSPYTSYSEDNDTWIIGDLLLGGLPTSLLFEEVREKLSLCYDISVSEFVGHGISFIKTDIDANSTDTVIDECKKQINKLINSDYDEMKLEATKEIIINSFIQSKDDFDILAKRYYNQYLTNRFRTIEERIEKIRKITKDDIAKMFKEYKPYFIYELKGTKNEKDI